MSDERRPKPSDEIETDDDMLNRIRNSIGNDIDILGLDEPFQRRIAELEAQLEETRTTIGCMFCGAQVVRRDDPDFADKIAEHIAVCDKHPAGKMADRIGDLESDNAALRAEVERLRKVRDRIAKGSYEDTRQKITFLRQYVLPEIAETCPGWETWLRSLADDIDALLKEAYNG